MGRWTRDRRPLDDITAHRPGTPVFTPASRGSAKRAPMRPHRANVRAAGRHHGPQARNAGVHTGIARERETSADEAAPCQRECRSRSQPRSHRSPYPRPRTFSWWRGVQADPIMSVSPGGGLHPASPAASGRNAPCRLARRAQGKDVSHPLRAGRTGRPPRSSRRPRRAPSR